MRNIVGRLAGPYSRKYDAIWKSCTPFLRTSFQYHFRAFHVYMNAAAPLYKAAVGWVVRPPAAGDETIYDAYMREAGDTGRTEVAIARLQRWRREHNVMWVSELFRADGITLRDRFMFNLAARARRCEPDAIRLCDIAFGRGRGPANKSARPRVGLPTPAAWDVVGIGSYVRENSRENMPTRIQTGPFASPRSLRN